MGSIPGEDRSTYAYDASFKSYQPDAVILPGNREELSSWVCKKRGLTIDCLPLSFFQTLTALGNGSPKASLNLSTHCELKCLLELLLPFHLNPSNRIILKEIP